MEASIAVFLIPGNRIDLSKPKLFLRFPASCLILEGVPDEVLSRPLLDGSRFHCTKDPLSHIPALEDGWICEDMLRREPVWNTIVALIEAAGVFAGFEIKTYSTTGGPL